MLHAKTYHRIGLMNLLNEWSSDSTQVLFPLIAGVGLGMLFHAPYQVFTRALKPQEIATGTSAFFLVRFTGATVGLVSPDTIFVQGIFKSSSRPLRVLSSTSEHRIAYPQTTRCRVRAHQSISVT